MRSAEPARVTAGSAAVWDIATPSRPVRLTGVAMAGFSDRTTELVDLRAVPHPAVTVAVDLGDGLAVVDDVTGRQHGGTVVAGLASPSLRARGRNVVCLQLRLSPVVAHAVLGYSAHLSGTVVALDDLWGRDAERTEERLRAAASWDERFVIA